MDDQDPPESVITIDRNSQARRDSTGLAVRGMTSEQIVAVARRGSWYESGVPRVEHYIEKGGWFADTAQELVAFLKDIEARYTGLEYISLSTPIGTPEEIMLDQYRRVMPHFKALVG